MTPGQLADLLRLRGRLLALIRERSRLPLDRGKAKPGWRRELRKDRRRLLVARKDVERDIVKLVLGFSEEE